MNYEQRKNQLANLIDTHDVISFDVFDTLIHRIASHAWSVPKLMEMQLKYSKLTESYPILGNTFADTRCNAERIARKERIEDTEVTFDEIYDVLQETLGLPDNVIHDLQRLELVVEGRVLYADPLMKEMFDYAVSQKKKVILVSDMYLPSSLLGSLLEGCGYNLTNIHIYVSCDWRKSKYRGDLFGCITEEGSLLHIGDNEHSDVAMVKAIRGAEGYHYDYQPPTSFSFNESLTQSIIDGVITKLWLEKEMSPELLLGAQLCGPLLTGFLIWLLAKLEGKQYDHILFLARDSSLFYKIIEKHLKDIELGGERIFTKLSPINYAYISRAAITLPTLFDISIQKIHRMIAGNESRSVREWLRIYGIDTTTAITREIHSCGFSSDEIQVKGSDKRMGCLLQQVYPLIIAASRPAKEEALKYFEQFKGERLAVVDLGWVGSVQQGFTKLMNCFGDTTVDGYYFSLWNELFFSRASLHDNYYAYLRDYDKDFFADIPTLLQQGGVELLEDIFSASTGTTLGYFDGGPILEDAEPDLLIEKLQESAMMFFEEVLPILRLAPLESFNSIDWMRPFFRMVEFPTPNEVEILGEICHTSGAGNVQHISVPIAPKVNEETCKDKQLYETAVKAAYWKQGFKLRNKQRS